MLYLVGRIQMQISKILPLLCVSRESGPLCLSPQEFLPNCHLHLEYEQSEIKNLVLLITLDQHHPDTIVLGMGEPTGHSVCFWRIYVLGAGGLKQIEISHYCVSSA